MVKFTVATATYNRAGVLHRVYDSLASQTYRDFEWIIVDDGSVDNTGELVESFRRNADFPVRYFYEKNSGKHIAINKAVREAQGELFIMVDSDDSFKPESLEILNGYWTGIPENEREKYRGVTCRCYDPETEKPVGREFLPECSDMMGNRAKFKYKLSFDMWGFNRLDVMRQFPYPNVEGLSFYPESVIWDRMDERYMIYFVNDALLAYYHDTENANTGDKRDRSRENICLWAHYINEMLGYFKYNPRLFIKAFTGMSMDGFRLGKSARQIISMANTALGKLGTVLFMPAGFILARWRR